MSGPLTRREAPLGEGPRSLLICAVLIDFNGHTALWQYRRAFPKINNPLREHGSRTRARARAPALREAPGIHTARSLSGPTHHRCLFKGKQLAG